MAQVIWYTILILIIGCNILVKIEHIYLKIKDKQRETNKRIYEVERQLETMARVFDKNIKAFENSTNSISMMIDTLELTKK